MTDIRDLYQEVVLDHSRSPRNFRKLEGADRSAEGYNPLCGDQYTVFLTLEEDVVKDVAFQGTGCAISKASASVMTTCLKGKSRAEIERLFERFHHLLTDEGGGVGAGEDLGKLAVFSGVREYPIRVKCATLAWHTLKAALQGEREVISTE